MYQDFYIVLLINNFFNKIITLKKYLLRINGKNLKFLNSLFFSVTRCSRPNLLGHTFPLPN